MSSRGLESKRRTPCGRRGGGHDPAGRVQPAGGPAAAELALGVAALALIGELERGQQHLLDGALHRAHGEALLEDAVGDVLVEVVEGVEQAGRDDGPSPRWRASSIAEEMLCVSSSALRSDSSSVRSYWRWPPCVRRGFG